MNNESKKIEINESNLKAAFKVADESTKKVLEALFGKKIELTDDNKPNLKDYKSIRSYEDACKALGESVDEKTLKKADVPNHIIALMKLELVCKALWGGEVKVYPYPNGNNIYWYPLFDLYNQSEIDCMSDEERNCILSVTVHNDTNAGFGSVDANNLSSYSYTCSSFRLCLDTEEKAEYFGTQFLDLWTEYIAYNFKVGERLK